MQKHFFTVFLLCIATGYGQDEGERIVFTSANPFSFYHVITDLGRQIPQEVYGVLRFPEGVEPKNLPLVVGVAGSMAWASHHYEYMEMYRKQGLATFELKSFASREVTSTVGTQVEVTTATMILDAYRALEALATDERFDISKAAITGWSLGGGVALYSAWQPLKDAISSNLGFAVKLSPTQTESSPAFSTCFAISKTGWILVGRSPSNNKPLVGSNMPNFNLSLVTRTYHYNLLGIHIWYQPVKQPWFHMRI